MPMTLSLEDTIIDTIVREDRRRNRGERAADDLDGHVNLARLKVAGLLAVLDGGRIEVNLDDWSLAGTITRTSREVRTELLELVRIEERKREEASTSKHVRREAAVVDSHVNRAVEHMAASIARHVHKQACEGGCVKRCVSRSTASAHRQLATVDDAIEHAVSLRWITSVDEHFRPGEARPS